jgi:hypothetical protein
VRHDFIGARSRAGVGRTEEGKTNGDGGLGSGEEWRRCGRWCGPKAETEGEVCLAWMRGHEGEKACRATLRPFYRRDGRAVKGGGVEGVTQHMEVGEASRGGGSGGGG